MDFLSFLRSLEEFVYEVITWLLFYPKTLWRAVRHPLALATETDVELTQDFKDQFTDLISPPLFLMLSLGIAHLAEYALHVSFVAPHSALGQAVADSDRNLLALRTFVYSVFPLMMATALLRHQRVRIDRATLKRPFYVQCFYVAPFAMFMGIAVAIGRVDTPWTPSVGAAMAVLGVVWFVSVETAWFRLRLKTSRARAAVIALANFAGGVTLCLVGATLLLGPLLGATAPAAR